MKEVSEIIGGFILFTVIVTVLAIGLSFVFAWPVMWLWNSTLPALFGLKVITYWQAWRLSLLSALLLKSGGSTSNSKN